MIGPSFLNRRILAIKSFVLLFLMASFCICHFDLQSKADTFPNAAILKINKKTYQLEVANTKEKARNGLMYRTQIPNNTGMAFPIQPADIAVFWMKNTLISLDMVFIRNEQVVRVLENVPPCPREKGNDCPFYNSVIPVDWVIELPAGTAKKDHIRVRHNTRLKFL